MALFGLDWTSASDVLLMNLLFLPWIVGPAALAAFGVMVSRSRAARWTFVGLEAVVIASTAAGWFYLIEVAPDAQNGIAMAFVLPFLQYVGVALLFVAASLSGWKPKDREAT